MSALGPDPAEPLDLDTCAREAIHIIGCTQAHGYLIAVSEPDLIVRHISANLAGALACRPGAILEQPLKSVLGMRQFEILKTQLAAPDLPAVNPLVVQLGRPAHPMECVVHRHAGMLLLEFEPQQYTGSVNIATDLEGPIARMEQSASLAGLAQVAAVEIAAISGFERVMIYRFDPDWNGHVIAEAGSVQLSYLGLHFPASDIPVQARRLFLINTLRSIVDTEAPPVELLPSIEPLSAMPLDLSRSLLRSASPMHIAYLRNMDVRATMTISLIVRGELWGMVTAHHSAPHRLNFSTRAICGLLGKVLATQILARSDNAALLERLQSRELIEGFTASLERSALPWGGEADDTVPLLALLHADGLISRIDGVTFRHGTTAEETQFGPVIAALQKVATRGIAKSSTLIALEPSAAAFAQEASGALFIGLSDTSDDYILLLRREIIQTILWAGNPDKSMIVDEVTGTLNPRASFAAWQETVRMCSLPWTELELQNARVLREQFIKARLGRELRARDVQFEQERARSTLFQHAVLPPRLPAVAGLTFDAVYEPGLSDANVGGDWYDAVRLLDGRVLLTIGDVAGSGVNAAVIMGVVRQIMRGIAQLHPDPALMLDAADRALRLEYPEAFVTAWVGIFDLVSRTLSYASAGHPPPLLVDHDGDVRELDHRTLPIGLRHGHEGHSSTINISHGTSLWLYTDGLIEATHNVLAGSALLRETAQRLGASALVTPAATIRRLVIPNGSPDDVAILVVKTNFNDSERHMTRAHFHSADAFAARKARRAFVASLSPERFSADDIANAELVFGELCGNVARYAPGRVDVVVDSSGVQVVLHVLDFGSGFRHLGWLPSDAFSETGRGLFIVAAMTTEFTVSPRAGGGSHARAVLVGRYPLSLLRDESVPAKDDQVAAQWAAFLRSG